MIYRWCWDGPMRGGESGSSFIWNDQIHIDGTLLTATVKQELTKHYVYIPRENKTCNLCRHLVGNIFYYLFLCAHPFLWGCTNKVLLQNTRVSSGTRSKHIS